MLRQNGYNKKDGGASFLELVLVMGIMAVLTPVVMKFAFNDLADVRYLNIANQVKQFTKATMAFVASKRSEWKNGSIGSYNSKELSDALGDSGLKDSVDERLLKSAKLRYIKDQEEEGKQEGSLVAYLLVDMSQYGLDFANFRKTLLFVGDSIGYVTDENCGICVSSGRCVCSINGDWADTYYNASGIQGSSISVDDAMTSYVGDERAMADEFTAVIRIDDNMLEKEYLSDFYLYRNSQGGDDGNVMYRNFSLGGHDIKNLRDIDVDTLSNSKGGRVPYINTDNAIFFGDVDISGSIFFGDDDFERLSIVGGAKMIAPRIMFWADNFFDEAAFEKAVLKQSPLLKSNSPVMNIGENIDFASGASVQAQTLILGGIKDSAFKVNEDEFTGRIGSVDSVSSNMKFRVPNLDVKNLDVKVLTVGQDMVSSDGGTVVATSGTVNSSGNLIIHNILGRSQKVDVFGKLGTFLDQTRMLKSTIVQLYADAYNHNNGDGENSGEGN